MWFAIAETVKYYFQSNQIQAPRWISVEFLRTDLIMKLFFIAFMYMVIDWIMQEKKNYRFMFYCLGSCLSSWMFYILTIDNAIEAGESAFTSRYAHYIYGIVFVVCVVLEKPFLSRSDKLRMEEN